MSASVDGGARRPFQIVGLGYVSLYVRELQEAVEFYSSVFGEPGYEENGDAFGWKMGSTWLTVFPSTAGTSADSNPRGIEFAVQVASAEQVDELFQRLVDAGATECMRPRDTTMYEPMRFACLDDPFGARIDVYCPMAVG